MSLNNTDSQKHTKIWVQTIVTVTVNLRHQLTYRVSVIGPKVTWRQSQCGVAQQNIHKITKEMRKKRGTNWQETGREERNKENLRRTMLRAGVKKSRTAQTGTGFFSIWSLEIQQPAIWKQSYKSQTILRRDVNFLQLANPRLIDHKQKELCQLVRTGCISVSIFFPHIRPPNCVCSSWSRAQNTYQALVVTLK